MRKYVLTGGPGTGKSSIILALERRGETVVREAAKDHIKFRQAQGIAEPWLEDDFQACILDLQVMREKILSNDRIFIDRGIPDGLAYLDGTCKTSHRIMAEQAKVRYDKVFLVESLYYTERTLIRREEHHQAIAITARLTHIYEKLGYEIVRIPIAALDERIDLIMREIQ
jgi:predicted ATPase